ncbi:hypothetical protein BR93DRAFT_381151 [Coniochaeta sp. PMI_546]|nr:hypothetical protein BR93DRAFT_381151 [Coniochaeta sp. PMI_546]
MCVLISGQGRKKPRECTEKGTTRSRKSPRQFSQVSSRAHDAHVLTLVSWIIILDISNRPSQTYKELYRDLQQDVNVTNVAF